MFSLLVEFIDWRVTVSACFNDLTCARSRTSIAICESEYLSIALALPMAIQVCSLEEASWRIAAPVLECMSVCRAFPPSATMIKSMMAGTWEPTGVWLQRADVNGRIWSRAHSSMNHIHGFR